MKGKVLSSLVGKGLHNKELHNLYSLPNIIRMIKSRMVVGAGHVTQIRERHKV
jgi:hypothetical protein